MTFRLPMLTMAVCGALCVPQLVLYAQQPIIDATPPIVQVRLGGDHDSANPLRHQGARNSFDDRQSAIGKMQSQAGSAHAQNSIPATVRQALYPNLPADGQVTPPMVQAVSHLEPVAPVKTPAEPVPVNGSQPPRTLMATEFAKLPKPERIGTNSVAADLPAQTVADLLATKASTLDSSTTSASFSDRLRDNESAGESQQQLQDLLQKIATSTCLVIFLGIGFIVVAKRVMRPKIPKTKQAPDASRIHVVANLRLTSKSNLHLVEVGDQRVLVASDLNGIKSVVSLTNSFGAALESLEDTLPFATDTTKESNNPPTGTYDKPRTSKQINAEIETDMQRKLSEVLGGEAFKDVFYKSTRAVA